MTQRTSFLRLVSLWLIASLLAAALVALFFLAAAVQLTSEETGTRVHRRSVATLTEIDALIPGIEAALDEADALQGGSVTVPGFPIPVRLTADEARTLRGAALRDRILDESAALIYDDGMGIWATADPNGVQRIERVSTSGIIKTGLGMAHDSRHTVFVAAAVLVGIIAFLLAAGLALTVRDWSMRLVALGSVVVLAALPCLAAAIAVRFGFKTAQTEADQFTTAMLDLGIDAMWVPIRDYLTLSALGFAVAGLGALAAWLQGRAPRRPLPLPPAAE